MSASASLLPTSTPAARLPALPRPPTAASPGAAALGSKAPPSNFRLRTLLLRPPLPTPLDAAAAAAAAAAPAPAAPLLPALSCRCRRRCCRRW